MYWKKRAEPLLQHFCSINGLFNSYSSFMKKLPTSLEMLGSSSTNPRQRILGEGMGGPTVDPEQMSQSHRISPHYFKWGK